MADKLYEQEPEFSSNDHLYGTDEPTTSFGERIDSGAESGMQDDAMLDDTATDEYAGEGGILGGAGDKLEDGFHETLSDSNTMTEQISDDQLAEEANRDYQK